MSISIRTKEGKVMIFEDNDRRTAGEQLFNWSIKHKPEWWMTRKKKNKKDKK